MESQRNRSLLGKALPGIALAPCAAVLLGWAIGHLVPNRPDYARIFGPDWLPPAVAAIRPGGRGGACCGRVGGPGKRAGLRAGVSCHGGGVVQVVGWSASVARATEVADARWTLGSANGLMV